MEEELGFEEVEEEWRAACNPCPGLLIKIAIAHNHHGGHDGDDYKDDRIVAEVTAGSSCYCYDGVILSLRSRDWWRKPPRAAGRPQSIRLDISIQLDIGTQLDIGIQLDIGTQLDQMG